MIRHIPAMAIQSRYDFLGRSKSIRYEQSEDRRKSVRPGQSLFITQRAVGLYIPGMENIPPDVAGFGRKPLPLLLVRYRLGILLPLCAYLHVSFTHTTLK